MKIINFGSLNIDHVYRVERFGQPGETLPSKQYRRGPGGKGLNQSVALAHAGMSVVHAGAIGEDGEWLLEFLQDRKVDTSLVYRSEDATGHAVIQVADSGENSILLHAGANQTIPDTHIAHALEPFGSGDVILLQNEINNLPLIMETAAEKEMYIVFNPAPFTPLVADYPLENVNLFIINEIEGQQLTGEDVPMSMMDALHARYPKVEIVLTLGANGAMYRGGDDMFKVSAEKAQVRDTTAAGDTFTGFYLAERLRGKSSLIALSMASKAAALCVTRSGAASSIPHASEVPG
ncbi:MAG: ribokinase [Kiritimatiellia bacterium]|jgi:ribokinase